MNVKIRKATRLTAGVFGFLAGIGGITHGIGEILQGSVRPDSIMIDSWVTGPIARNMGGDPGMTIIPNLLITGIIGIIVSLATMIWSAFFVQKKFGGWILIGLAILMMLFGGGFGSPIIAILAGLAGTSYHASLKGWKKLFSGSVGRVLSRLWGWVFSLAALDSFFLFVGALFLVFVFDWGNEDLYLASFFIAVMTVGFSVVTGIARDVQRSMA